MRRKQAILILLPFIVFILLPVLEPYLHNHEIDGEEHHDCPACKWLIEFNTTAVIYVFVSFFALILTLLKLGERARSFHIRILKRGRAPPARALP